MATFPTPWYAAMLRMPTCTAPRLSSPPSIIARMSSASCWIVRTTFWPPPCTGISM
jgi:hypothetical protein